MTENEEKILLKIDDNKRKIERAVRLIEHHREQIRIYKKRGAELAAKLEQSRLKQLYKTVLEEGCDIAALNAAIKNGDISLKIIEESATEISDEDCAVIDDTAAISDSEMSEYVQNNMRNNHNNCYHESDKNDNE
jgi:hypothetical protein